MSGRRLITGFLILLAVFTAALIYFQFFAYYSRDRESTSLSYGGVTLPVSGLDRIEATSSPLKLRACFQASENAFAGLAAAENPTPLTPPPWFRCFDARALAEDIAAGNAQAYLVAADAPEGFDVMLAFYPDGRSYLWRQLGSKFAEH